MITVEYLNEMISTEPGPNLYWRGKCQDYAILVREMDCLVRAHDGIVDFSCTNLLEVKDGYQIRIVSVNNGIILNSIVDKKILIELDPRYWREVLSAFSELSESKGHVYLDFDNEELIEQANWIISSEA